jgi:hypothetical protein
MQRIGRIPPGAMNSPLQSNKKLLGVVRGESRARGAISLIRCIRHIRVELLNLDGSHAVKLRALPHPAERFLHFVSRRLEAQARFELALRPIAIAHALVDEAQTKVR